MSHPVHRSSSTLSPSPTQDARLDEGRGVGSRLRGPSWSRRRARGCQIIQQYGVDARYVAPPRADALAVTRCDRRCADGGRVSGVRVNIAAPQSRR